VDHTSRRNYRSLLRGGRTSTSRKRWA